MSLDRQTAALRLPLKPRIARDLRWRKHTRHFPIREWDRFPPESCQRRNLSCALPETKPAISRGNWTKCDEKCQIARTLRLYGGPGRDRTDDLFHAMEARSQLRHRPTGGINLFSWSWNNSSTKRKRWLRHFRVLGLVVRAQFGNHRLLRCIVLLICPSIASRWRSSPRVLLVLFWAGLFRLPRRMLPPMDPLLSPARFVRRWRRWVKPSAAFRSRSGRRRTKSDPPPIRMWARSSGI